MVNLTLSDGLAGETVNRVMTDHRGYTWIATTGGVSIYNGRHLMTMRIRNGKNRPLSVSDLCETRSYDIYAATEDGSAGTKGNVLDAVRENGIEADVICACGPLPMLRAISRFAAEKGIPAFLSLEERMACGVGVCLGCVTKTKKIDSHSKVNNARVCVEGPVFSADEVDL